MLGKDLAQVYKRNERNRVYVRTDKNGTKIYHDYTCRRCGGAGGADQWTYTGWNCYECGGTGRSVKPQVVKEYTPEYRAKLDAAAEKRAAKRQAELEEKRKAEYESNGAQWLTNHGFTAEGYTYFFLGDTYAAKEQIKADGGKYDNVLGWHADHEISGLNSFKVHVDELASRTYWGYYEFNITYSAWQEKKRAAERQLTGAKASEYVGKVGEKLVVNVVYVKRASFDGYMGQTTYIHTMKDTDGNVFIWKTTSPLERVKNGEYIFIKNGEQFTLKGSVKEHSEYKGEKQTVLTRCRVA